MKIDGRHLRAHDHRQEHNETRGRGHSEGHAHPEDPGPGERAQQKRTGHGTQKRRDGPDARKIALDFAALDSRIVVSDDRQRDRQ